MTSRKFRITVEGETFEVEVQEIGGFPGSRGAPLQYAGPQRAAPPPPPAPRSTLSSPPPPRPTTPAPPAAPPTSPAVARQPTVAASGAVVSPMPGTVLSIKVKAGDQVKAGEVLLILESMKIQNEISAPKGGTVKEVFVKQGEYVKSKHLLVAIE
ncbi:MAG: biotin/lipoyl-containing protein [Chloroflexota bacterium]